MVQILYIQFVPHRKHITFPLQRSPLQKPVSVHCENHMKHTMWENVELQDVEEGGIYGDHWP
jgi:hypothetical protein